MRLDEVGNLFLRTFYDDVLGRFRRSDEPLSHWRAVDQAVGCLASLRLSRLDPKWSNTDTYSAGLAARSSIRCLLDDFGYGGYLDGGSPPVNHLGEYPGTRRANSWHDSLACYALMAGGAGILSPQQLAKLLQAMAQDYTAPASGLLVHQRHMLDLRPEQQVQFSCAQAIWSAVGRAAQEATASGPASEEGGEGTHGACAAIAAHRKSWVHFHTTFTSASASGLLPVANVYSATRLWCNAEPAAWLLIERSDFAPLSSEAGRHPRQGLQGEILGWLMGEPIHSVRRVAA